MTTLNNNSAAMAENQEPLKVYLIAGEPSGDLLGSRLMRALTAKTNGKVNIYGLGGDTKETAGLKP